MNITTRLAPAMDELLARILPVMVILFNRQRGAGAGIIIGSGQILTNAHVTGRSQKLRAVLADNRETEAIVAARDPRVDLALLRIPLNGYPATALAHSPPRPGEIVFAFGHPWGIRNVLTAGVVSAVTVARTLNGDFPLIRSDLQLAPGNSGGPLLNAAGEVIGLNAMIFGGDQSVAIPASVIRGFLEKSGFPLEVVH